MAYKSKINLKLAQQPLSKSAENYGEMLDIYNSIHILAQWANALSDVLEGSGIQTPGTGQDGTIIPTENTVDTDLGVQWPPTRTLVVPARNAITAGTVCTLIPYRLFLGAVSPPLPDPSEFGAYPGFSGLSAVTRGSQTSEEIRTETAQLQFAGVAANDAAVGEPVTLYFGPGIIASEGVQYGMIYGVIDRVNEQQVLTIPPVTFEPGQLYPMDQIITRGRVVHPVGFGIKEGYLYFDPAMGQKVTESIVPIQSGN